MEQTARRLIWGNIILEETRETAKILLDEI